MFKEIKNSPITLAFVFSSLLTGCDLKESEQTKKSESANNDPKHTSIKDIQIDRSNDLRSTYHLNIDIDISKRTQERTYISICSDMNSVETPTHIDYKDCFFKSSIVNGMRSTQLRLPLHITRLVAILWFFEENKPPVMIHYSPNMTSEKVWKIY